MPLNVAVSGATGRMGRSLARLIAESDEFQLVGGIARSSYEPRYAAPIGYDQIEAPKNAYPILDAADVLIDFSSPDHLVLLLDTQRDVIAGRALVVGTTGLGQREFQRLEDAAHRSPVVLAANFSVGVNVLLALTETAARLLDAERYDAEVIEIHHRKKLDAPSGTALALGRAIARARGVELDDRRRDGRSGRGGERPAGEIGFHAVRGGDVAGEHRTLFLGARERLELSHVATDRALFAEGALLAARWVVDRPPGQYSMREVLGV